MEEEFDMKRIILIALLAISTFSLAGCGGESQYDKDFKSGMEKYNSGGKMTEGEANAVKNFKNWQSKQGEKTYDEWNK